MAQLESTVKEMLKCSKSGYIGVPDATKRPKGITAYANNGRQEKAGGNPTESELAGKRRAHTPMSRQRRPVLRHCAWTAAIPILGQTLIFVPGQRNCASAQCVPILSVEKRL